MSSSRSRSRSGCAAASSVSSPIDVCVTPERELRLDSPLQRAQPQLVEARDGALGERLSAPGRPARPRARARAPRRARRPPPRARPRPRARTAPRSAAGRAPRARRGRRSPGAPGLDRLLAERPAQLGDLAVHLRHRGRRGVAGVELVRDAVDRDHPTGLEQQQREDRALDAPAERDLCAVAARLEWAEDAERDHGGTVAAR